MHRLQLELPVNNISSIVFSDEGDILSDSQVPDLDYNRLVRAWKSQIGLFCFEKPNVILNITLIALTALAIISKQRTLLLLGTALLKLNAPDEMIAVARGVSVLVLYAPSVADGLVRVPEFGNV